MFSYPWGGGHGLKNFAARIRKVGPALVLAAVVLGPGSITLSTVAGAQYGYRMLWVLVCATVFMLAYTAMAARIALVTRRTLFDATRHRYGPLVARLAGLFAFLSILSFQAGNAAAVGFSGQALLGWNVRSWALLFTAAAGIMLVTKGLYRKIEILVKIVVALMVVGFLGTLLMVGIEPGPMSRGLIPSFPDQASVFLALGMAATTFSIAAAAYQGHLMKEKKWEVSDLSLQGLDTFLGISLLGGISIVVLLTSAAVIGGSGASVFDAQTMAAQLEPVAGPAAHLLFSTGFFFAGFSSLVVNPLVGATLLADGFGWESGMESRAVRTGSFAALIAGAGVVLIFEGSPIELLRIAQALAVVAFPLLGFLVWSLARDRRVMGEYANSNWMNALGLLGFLTILGIVFNNLRLIVLSLF